MQYDYLCVFHSTAGRELPAYVEQDNMFSGAHTNILLKDDFSFRLQINSERPLIWKDQRTRSINTILLKQIRVDVVESWFRQGSHSVIPLTFMCSVEEFCHGEIISSQCPRFF